MQISALLCRLRSIATHRDHFVRRPSVCLSVRPSYSHSYVSQATHAFLGMLPLFCSHLVKLMSKTTLEMANIAILGKFSYTYMILVE